MIAICVTLKDVFSAWGNGIHPVSASILTLVVYTGCGSRKASETLYSGCLGSCCGCGKAMLGSVTYQDCIAVEGRA